MKNQEFTNLIQRLQCDKLKNSLENTLAKIISFHFYGHQKHVDLIEIGIAEFIQQFMYDFDIRHVGKDFFRTKKHEEDIVIINEMTKAEIPVSLKVYGDGPLQLLADEEFKMFPKLCEYGGSITDKRVIGEIFASEAFQSLESVNVMSFIYREEKKECNIMVFDFDKMREKTEKILLVGKGYKYDEESQQVVLGKGRKHPIYMFIDGNGRYICEVRYGNATASALQRGFWTHTKKAVDYFVSLTNGWKSYEHNLTLGQLFNFA